MDHPAPVGAGEEVFQQAVALHERGRLDQAELLYRALLGDNRDHLGARHNLGILCFQRGDYDGAVALTREVVRQQPELATAHNTLAVALKHLGRLAEAESSSREAVRQAPEYAEAHNTLGDTLTALGRFTEAEQCCRTALRLFPEYAEAHNNLATVLLSLGRPEEAEICARRALRLKPLDAAVHANLGAILFAAGRLDQAELCYREALRLNPTDGAICGNLGNTLDLRGELSQAVAAFERALTLRPGDAALLETWFSKKRLICDWARFLQDEAKFRKGLSGEPRASAAFRLLGVSSTPAEQFTYARRVAAQLAVGQLGEFHGQSHGNRRRLRVGYLLLIQPTGHLIAGLVENHDRQRFEIIGYSASLDDGSALRLRLARAFDRFVDVSKIQDQDAAGLIRNDQLDILVDLIGFKPNGRAKIPAHRPSPLQVNYLGYPGTMGADYIDYIIVDRFVAPQNQQPFFSERLVHLPGCYQCNDDKREIAAHVPSRAECGLPERGFVFCCFNDSYKLTPAFFDIWMQLLNAVPGSVLWLLESAAEAKGNLAREAAARGVAPERIVFAPRFPLPDHLARHRLADLFLDTLPYNAHVTASDALWVGLPVLTCAGNTFAGRVAGSLLQAIGLDELITTCLQDYKALALRLAANAGLLARLRAKLARNRQTFPLFNTARSTRNLEAAYLQMNEIRRAERPPTPFSVFGA